ncbi:MAG: helicase, partial [Muribaculaceae bacterium]|nr:helicase [Muribaculaceae bacterium]
MNFSFPAQNIASAAEPAATYEKQTKSEAARDIDSNEIFTYIFNVKTIDLVLQTLMNEGLKVQSGERIGKSVIFAYNHAHAELIVQRFNILYPEYGASFCALIDNYVDYAQNLIERFEIRDGDPQIAVSVDMLDTGIDVPDILNLVFFKRVKSKIKFQQMIGRGTRLSSGIFGHGKDKKFFIIFDWCANFDYFDQHENGQEAVQSISLTERLFGLRAEIAMHLQHQKYQADEFAKGLHDELKTLLLSQVSVLSDHHISVRHNWESVSRFKKAESWQALSELDVWTLKSDIAPLIPKSTLDENAKKFDVLMLLIELSLLDSQTNASKSIQKVRTIADNLQKKASLPQVQAKMDTINEVLDPAAWDNVSLNWLEKVRLDLRDLIKFLVSSQNQKFVIDIDDAVIDEGTGEGIAFTVSYKQKVMDFLRENRNIPVLRRIYNLQQLSPDDIKELERILWEELGNREDYDKLTNEMAFGSNVGAFIRSMMGIDRQEAIKMFGDFITDAKLNSEQEDFLKTIVDYVSQNGDIDRETVVNEYPFSERLS